MQPLSEQEEFEFRLRAEREANSKQSNQPTEKAPFQIPQKIGEAIGTGIGVGGQVLDKAYKASLNPIQRGALETAGKIYQPIRDFAVNTVGAGQREIPKILTDNSGLANAFETARKKPLIGGNIPVKQFSGGKLVETGNIPVNASFDDLQKGVQGLGFDYLAGRFGPEVVSGGVKGAVKNVDKTITSATRRIGGLTSSDIKNTRRLTSEYGPSKVFSKVKAKPSYVGSEIAPKASELAASNVRSMRPESLRELGVSADDTATAQRLKDINGITEFPTKSSADEFYARMYHETPNDVQIPTTNTERVYLENKKNISPKLAERIEAYTNRTTGNNLGTLDKAPMTKAEYSELRNLLINSDPKGEVPAIQAIKGGLDRDFSVVNPKINEANDLVQLSRNTPKVESYLDKQSLPKQMESQLRSAANPESFQAKESLKRLLGDESKDVLDELESSRLAGEYYGNTENSGINMGRKAPYEFFRKLTRPIARSYEEARANLSSIVRGKPSPTKPNPIIPIVSNKVESKPSVEIPKTDIEEVRRNAYSFVPKSINVSDEAIANAREMMAKADTEAGRFPYQTQVPNNQPYYPTPLGDNPDVPYKAPTGNLGIKFPEPEPQATSGAGPYQPIPGNLTYEPTDIPSDIYSSVKKESVSKRISKRNKKGKK